jgi:glycosyltransferase involved in cell wall biosynthesis
MKEVGFITLLEANRPHFVLKTFADSVNADFINSRFYSERKFSINLFDTIFTGLKNLNKYDILIINGVTGLISASVIKFLSHKKPEVIYLDVTPIFFQISRSQGFKFNITKKMLGVVDRYITVSDLNRRYIKKVVKKKVDIVNTFHEININHKSINTEKIRNQFFYIGRFSSDKNIINIVKAFKEFNKKYPETKLKIAGYGKLKEEVIRETSGNQNIEFLGKISHEKKVKLLKESAFLFQLSVYDSFPVSVLEAMFSKTLPLASDKVGTAQLLDKRLVYGGKSNDIESMAGFIEDVFQISESDRKLIAEKNFREIKSLSKENQKREFARIVLNSQ